MWRGFLAILVLVSLAMPARPEVPLPRPKPGFDEMQAVAVPKPRPKPIHYAKATAGDLDIAVPPEPVRQWPGDAGLWPKAETVKARAACQSILGNLDIIWRPDSPIGETGGCGTPAPIAVSEIAGVRINPPATVNCAFAAALNGWITNSLQPAARKELGTRVTEIRTASSYACRRRNNAASGKLSEHGKANALDMAGFVFEKKVEVSMMGDWAGVLQSLNLPGRGNFLRRIRKDSCQYFNTVLGPGTDRYHKDHLHVDLMPLRPGRFKMCR